MRRVIGQLLAATLLVGVLACTPTPAGNGGGGGGGGGGAPVTLLDLAGSGIKKSQPFTTTGSWTLAYTFDCSAFANGTGNFIVTVFRGTDLEGVAVNELAPKGDSSTTEYAIGEVHLEMNSTCDSWHVRVTQP